MMLYKRFVDVSNQMARVPPEGAKSDTNTKKLVVTDEEAELRSGEALDYLNIRTIKN